MTLYTRVINTITNIGTTVAARALTTPLFKAKFDYESQQIQTFINETLIPEIEASIAALPTDAELTEATHRQYMEV